MNKLYLKNLLLWGIHGLHTSEQQTAQPFNIDIAVTYDFTRSMVSDDILDTVDYKIIEAATRKIIEGEPKKLIEVLAGDIADAVLRETEASSVEVSVAKPRAKSFGVPQIHIEKSRVVQNTKSIVELLDFNCEKVTALYSPETDGIIQLKGMLYKILDETKLREWYEKKWPSFEKKEEKYIQNNQEVSVVYNGPFKNLTNFQSPQEIALHNLYHKIRNELAKYSDIPFPDGDRLETKLIKYPISTLGVGAHKDLSSNINAIILFNFYGTTTFYTADDKERGNEKAYLVEPGDIVIMRGPRTKAEAELRPIHYVLDIAEERLVFVCREIEDKTETIINKGNWMGF